MCNNLLGTVSILNRSMRAAFAAACLASFFVFPLPWNDLPLIVTLTENWLEIVRCASSYKMPVNCIINYIQLRVLDMFGCFYLSQGY